MTDTKDSSSQQLSIVVPRSVQSLVEWFTIKLVMNNTEVEFRIPNRLTDEGQRRWRTDKKTGQSRCSTDIQPAIRVEQTCSVRVHVEGTQVKSLNSGMQPKLYRPEQDPRYGTTRRWMQIGYFEPGKVSMGLMLRLDKVDPDNSTSCLLTRVSVCLDKGVDSWFTD